MPGDFRSRVQPRPKRGHRERDLDITGEDSSGFRLIIRESMLNPLDFSVVLAYRLPQSSDLFRLRRYNGLAHEHTNSMERQSFYNFHIHQATQRYQELGADEDSYAEPTDRYGDLQQAIDCMLVDCNFDVPPQLQERLF